MIHESVYVPGEGGTRIAADAWAPSGERRPAVLVQHRYWRGADLRWPFGRGGPRPGAAAARMLAAGYAVVDTDVRGAGASFGARPDEWPPEEAGDAAAVLDWIASRPWSDGRVAAVGVSYGGTAALLLAARGHPALRAVAARFCFWDLADDLVLPGGVRNTWLAERWAERVAVLDRGRLPIGGLRARLAVRGPQAVAGSRRDLRAAIAEHGSEGSRERGRTVTAEQLRGRAPSSLAAAIRASGVAVHSLGGWYDGASTRATVAIHRSLGGELVLGPWDHGGYHDVSPRNASGEMRFDIAGEVLGFLGRAFSMAGAEAVPAVRYHVVGEERWQSARAWPPPGTTGVPLHLGAAGTLSPAPPAAGVDDHELDLTASSGERTRWRGQLQPAPPTSYAGRPAPACAYTSMPFPDGLEITGEPACLLMLEAGAERTNLFCYLDEIAPDGSATYITEGCCAGGRPVALHGPCRAPADRLPGRTREARFACRSPPSTATCSSLLRPSDPGSACTAAGRNRAASSCP